MVNHDVFEGFMSDIEANLEIFDELEDALSTVHKKVASHSKAESKLDLTTAALASVRAA